MGFQFGINKDLTEYAHQVQWQDAHKCLPAVDITVLEVWKDDKRVSYLLVDEKTNKPLKDVTAGYEACAVAIDAFKLIKDSENYED